MALWHFIVWMIKIQMKLVDVSRKFVNIAGHFPCWTISAAQSYTLGKKGCYTPGMLCLFCDYFYFISPRGLRTGCLVWYNVFYVFDALFCYSVVFCQFWGHLMIKWVIGRMCIPKCHWKIIVVNLVEQRWFFSWRCLVVSFCVCQFNIGYSRLSWR